MKREESFLTNMTKFYIVSLISERPSHGYDIIARLESIMGKNFSASQIYPILKKLEKRGIIESGKSGVRGKKVYSLTGKGRKFYANLTSKLSLLVEAAIRQSLSSCSHCSCIIYGKPFAKKIGGKSRNFCCKYCANEYKPAN